MTKSALLFVHSTFFVDGIWQMYRFDEKMTLWFDECSNHGTTGPMGSSVSTRRRSKRLDWRLWQYIHLTIAVATFLMFAYAASVAHEILDILRHSSAASYPSRPIPRIKPYDNNINDDKKRIRTVEDTGPIKILVVYGPSDDPYLPLMADRVADGIRSSSARQQRQDGSSAPLVEVSLKTIDAVVFREDVLTADAVVVGSAVENGNTHHAVQRWINTEWDILEDFSQKVGAAFVTAGGISAGEELATTHLLQSMMVFGMIVVGGMDWTSPFGASAVTYEQPFTTQANTNEQAKQYFDSVCYQPNNELIHPLFLDKAFGLGVRVGQVTARLYQSCTTVAKQ